MDIATTTRIRYRRPKRITEEWRQSVRHALGSFSGTDKYHVLNGAFPRIFATDGVYFLCQSCEAYWLFEAIASWQYHKNIRKEPFQVWKLVVEQDGSASLRAEDGDYRLLTCQDIPITDFPLPEGITLWVEASATENGKPFQVVLLPGEH